MAVIALAGVGVGIGNKNNMTVLGFRPWPPSGYIQYVKNAFKESSQRRSSIHADRLLAFVHEIP